MEGAYNVMRIKCFVKCMQVKYEFDPDLLQIYGNKNRTVETVSLLCDIKYRKN